MIEKITLKDYVGTGKHGESLHQSLNFTFEKNHLYLVKGENGSGKTTLIENLLHLTERYRGTIELNGSDVWINDFTYVPSKPYISEFYNAEIHKGSDGQKKFFQIADLTREAGTVIILDEPTNYLDTDRKTELIQKINGLIRDHIVIVITHDPVFDVYKHDCDSLQLEKSF